MLKNKDVNVVDVLESTSGKLYYGRETDRGRDEDDRRRMVIEVESGRPTRWQERGEESRGSREKVESKLKSSIRIQSVYSCHSTRHGVDVVVVMVEEGRKKRGNREEREERVTEADRSTSVVGRKTAR